jgi:hypothetical protein
MLVESLSTYNHLAPGNTRDAALQNVAYFAVAAKALGLIPGRLPAAAERMVAEEWKEISAHAGRRPSRIFPYQVDFSQFVPRGHYAGGADLKHYFMAMTWYGVLPFALEWPERATPPRVAYEQIRQSLLIARVLYETKLDGKPVIRVWDRIYEPTVFYVETTDDLTPADWLSAAEKVWGHLPNPAELAGKPKLNSFHQVAMAMRTPRIATFAPQAPQPILDIPTGPQFRFMGQRAVPDAYWLQQLVWSNVGTEEHQRRMPMGLDVFAALGSQRAGKILDQLGETKYANYTQQMGKLKAELSAKREQDWRSNLYWGWLWTLKGLVEPAGDGYPSFMRTQAWLDKQLNSGLANWSELRHDTILYAKQSETAECGGGHEVGPQPPVPKGYVEPAVEVYHRLLWLTKATRAGLRHRALMTRELDDSFGRMEDLLTFLERVSLKELANRRLKAAEYDQIRLLGAELHNLFNQVTSAIGGKSGALISQSDSDMAVIADVHSDLRTEQCLEEAVGPANEIFVVVPIGGKLYLTHGTVFSYYEFPQPIGDRLTDDSWQDMLSNEKAPKPPSWTSTFMADPKPEIPVPKWPRTDESGSGSC